MFVCLLAKYGNMSMDWSVPGFEMWSPLTISFEVLWTARHAQTTCWVTLLFSTSTSSQTGVEGTKQVWLQVPSSVRVTAQEFSAYIQNHLHTIWCSFPMPQLTHVCAQEGVQCFRPCRGWEANPRTTGFVAELALTPQTQHEGYGQTPERHGACAFRANTNKHQLFSHSSWPMCNILWLMENLEQL